jgi:predicted nucleic acid-binding protein
MLYLADVRERLTIVSLDESAYFETLEAAVAVDVRGGQIYDALLLRCARQAGVDTILTWNVKHFQRIAPDLTARITTP